MKLFGISRENNHTIFRFLGLKFSLGTAAVEPLGEFCCIPKLEELKLKNTKFVHPFGIVIIKSAQIGYNCTIYHNVTIGWWKKSPKIGNNVTIYPNSMIIGDVEIGDNVIIGAGSVVTKSIPANKVAAGNPVRIIRDVAESEIIK